MLTSRNASVGLEREEECSVQGIPHMHGCINSQGCYDDPPRVLLCVCHASPESAEMRKLLQSSPSNKAGAEMDGCLQPKKTSR